MRLTENYKFGKTHFSLESVIYEIYNTESNNIGL